MHRTDNFAQNLLKHPLWCAIAAAAACSLNAGAEDKILEEVIVTSQKRAQSLQEVPISVAAVTGETIEKMGIENLEDLTAHVPNIHFTETGLSTQMRVRGIGSDNSQGFEQSVGIYVDGIYRSRAQLFRAPIFDVERVEVMRGPQSTLFGKNSIAGAVDIITAKPTDEFKGQLTASYEGEFGTREASGFVSGPLSQTLNGRIALRYYDDPGYMTNTFKNQDEPNQEEKAIRTSLDWTPTDNLNVLFVAERDTFDVQGRAIEITQDIPGPFGTYSERLAQVNQGVTFDSQQNYERQMNAPEFSENTVNSQTLRIDYQIGDISMTAVTGILGFNYLENCDCDYTPANIFDLDLMEEYDQVSQEIRFVSPEGQSVEWLAGVFVQSYDQTFVDNFNVPKGSLLLPIINPALPPDRKIPESFTGTGVRRNFEQSSDTWAVFAEATWYASATMDVTLGARFTEEEKEAHKVLNIVDITNNNAVLNDPILASIYASPLLFATDTEQSANGHNLTGERNESAFTPALTVRYHVNDDIMTYAKASKGFKAGGFDPRSNNTITEDENGAEINNFEFEDEEVIAVEIGSKMRLAGGRSEVNIALFDMAYDNLQISQFDGAVGFNPGNAKDTQVRGIEIDGRWQINEHFTSAYGVAYLDFEYKDFTTGNCHFGQTAAANGFCDYTGKRGVYTPEYTFNGSLEYSRELQAGLMLVSNLDVQWIDRQQVHVNLDPRGEIPSHTLLSLRMALETERWGLALLGKNLLNEHVITYSGNAPLSETLIRSNTFYSVVQRPRTVAMEATYKF